MRLGLYIDSLFESIERSRRDLKQCFEGVKRELCLFAPVDNLKASVFAHKTLSRPKSDSWPLGPYDIVLVFDVSASMGDTDFYPSRLEGAKQAAEQFIHLRARLSPNDRVAIVAFTETAEIILPLTQVSNTVLIINKFKALEPIDGTDIAAGLQAAETALKWPNILRDRKQKGRRILLLTDGHGGKPIELADKLRKEINVLIEVVGIGSQPSVVNEMLLRKVATTDHDGLNHYWFIRDTNALVSLYAELATGLVWKGKAK